MWIEYCTKDGQAMKMIERDFVPDVGDTVLWQSGDPEKPLTKKVSKRLLVEAGQQMDGRWQVWLADVKAKKV